ncbi:hypothetical protein C1Y63_07730 [Corynebacterium sp. 13CS0277]|uniref:polyadenylate-specific 3'-exoribonuclease AS n=1 Tax=Corynebacterium sp. 13CS0277 TaxID=2071994 RepID=UPI000D0290E6|nr:polyadenylate-specific 3'-exoribonuclease AS [Corynebacterium sp. 13CS0277]PRQ11137.1 hypothetical protein C1Y63_07730 [Corynebacterium sp. 13CS0277]
MRYFYDTEFIEDGSTIELVSIGIVAEDGREYYAVSTEFDRSKANSWVRANVLNKLPSPASPVWKDRATIRDEVYAFLKKKGYVELWAWVGAYDHVVLAQLWGDMQALPRDMPRYTAELKHLWHMAGKPALPEVPEGHHDALVDARHNKAKFDIISRALGMNHHSVIGAKKS